MGDVAQEHPTWGGLMDPVALVFDCDGTLVDTMGGFYTADLRTCEEFGLTMSKKQFYDLAGVPIREIFKILAEAQGKTPDLDAMAARCKEIADELMHEGPGLIHPVVAIARDAKAKGLPVAVASSGVKPTVTGGDFPRLNGIHLLSYPLVPDDESAARCSGVGASVGLRGLTLRAGHLRGHGILDLFDTVVTCEDVTRGKPAPDLYLLAAERLGVDPTRCTAYEDAELGMQSARAAGMTVVDVRLLEGYPADDYKV